MQHIFPIRMCRVICIYQLFASDYFNLVLFVPPTLNSMHYDLCAFSQGNRKSLLARTSRKLTRDFLSHKNSFVSKVQCCLAWIECQVHFKVSPPMLLFPHLRIFCRAYDSTPYDRSFENANDFNCFEKRCSRAYIQHQRKWLKFFNAPIPRWLKYLLRYKISSFWRGLLR